MVYGFTHYLLFIISTQLSFFNKIFDKKSGCKIDGHTFKIQKFNEVQLYQPETTEVDEMDKRHTHSKVIFDWEI